MTSRPRAQCDACTHLRPRTDEQWAADAPFTCDAFPAGIPDPIYDNELDHRAPIDGDHGIQFEAKTGDAFPEYAFI